MTGLAHPSFTERLVPRDAFAQASQAPDRDAAPTGPAFGAANPFPSAAAPAETAPADPRPPAQAGAVVLSEASTFILSLVSAHEGRAPEDILAELIAAAADAIGVHSLIMRDTSEVDLADLPDFARRAANRFRGGGP